MLLRVLLQPLVWFVALSAWARERSAIGAFQTGGITRTEYEQQRKVVADLRKRADRLRARCSPRGHTGRAQ